MTKFLIALLASFALLFAFAACSESSDAETDATMEELEAAAEAAAEEAQDATETLVD